MTINKLRLQNQLLIKDSSFKSPYDIVKWFCGMQAQDYISAKWAIGIRLEGSTDEDIEAAIANKSIVRTWSMRGTLQFVTGDDIRWLTDLFARQRLAANAFRNRQLKLDRRLFNKCNSILEKNLSGGKQLTRDEIKNLFHQRGISVDGVQLSHILQNATFEKLICYGVKRGSQITFTLLDEWIPDAGTLDRETALAEIIRRYFKSRGPATLKDFTWWSGLTIKDARGGINLAKDNLVKENIKEETCWLPRDENPKGTVKSTLLLPAFDEYLISYKDRSSMLDKQINAKLVHNNGMFSPVIVINGKVIGTWKRVIKKESVEVTLTPFIQLNAQQTASIKKELKLFGKYLQKKI